MIFGYRIFQFRCLAVFVVLVCTMIPNHLFAKGLDERMNDAFMPFAQAWESLIFTPIQIGGQQVPLVLILLLGGAFFFTCYFSFVNIRRFPMAIRVVSGKYDQLEAQQVSSESPSVFQSEDGDIIQTIKDESSHGEVSHFQALTTAVSGTVGLGNIAMVAVAISLGGPGATFWMIIAGLLGMSTKFVECTLGVKFRDVDSNGRVYGGPMYYLSKGLKQRGYKNLGRFLAALFAVLCIGASLGGGNAFQSNQATAQIVSQLGLEGQSIGTLIGLSLAVLVGIVIIGGIRRIGQVTARVVPFMALIYIGAALFILISHSSLLDDAIGLIFSEAFTPRASISGGIIGVMIQGFRRAAFSNEAGAGSAAIAHSAVNTRFPVSEGLVALLEPFIDTVVICTMTALVIVIFNFQDAFVYGDTVNNLVLLTSDNSRIGGVNLTSMAFDSAIPGFSVVLMIAVVLFAFSTMLSWSYYGLQSWKYLFGRSGKADMIFKVLFLSFTVLGSAVTMDAVIKFSDAMILALVFPNMIGLFFLFGMVKDELNKYLNAIRGFQPDEAASNEIKK